LASALLCASLIACGSDPRPTTSAPKPAGASLPLDPPQLAELRSSLEQLQQLCATAQSASDQGKARLIQKQLETFVDKTDSSLPFRKNIQRIVSILGQNPGDDLTSTQKTDLKSEIQSILKELGVEASPGQSDHPMPAPPPPGGPGPGGPGPGGPGPGAPG